MAVAVKMMYLFKNRHETLTAPEQRLVDPLHLRHNEVHRLPGLDHLQAQAQETLSEFQVHQWLLKQYLRTRSLSRMLIIT